MKGFFIKFRPMKPSPEYKNQPKQVSLYIAFVLGELANSYD